MTFFKYHFDPVARSYRLYPSFTLPKRKQVPTLSVIAVFWSSTVSYMYFRFPDGTEVDWDKCNIHHAATQLDESTWLALRKAMLTPDTWVAVAN